MRTIMACDHVANATNEQGEPVCAICYGTDSRAEIAVAVSEEPDLTGREARCGCGSVRPSSTDLAFFEYRGVGSRQARESCKHCGYNECAHDPAYMDTLVHNRDGSRRQTVVESGKCLGFEARGAWDYDLFYCGCRGWD
jgi:hypothetical protein